MESSEVRFEGAGGDEVRGTLVAPDAPARGTGGGPAVVLIADGMDELLRESAVRLARYDLASLAVDLRSRGDDGVLPDRRVNADLEGALAFLAARDRVDAGRLAAIGFGTGGTWAWLLGCCSRDLAAAAAFAPPLVHPELSPERPAQPLEMGLNLSVPFLALFGESDASVPAADVERLRAVVSQFSRDCDIVVYPGAGDGFFDPRRDAYDEGAAEDAWRRTLALLRESLDLEDQNRE